MSNGFGANNNNWKGGRSVAPNGYVIVRVGVGFPGADCRGYIYEHRLVGAQKIGRPLLRSEQVHHIDGNKQNNDPDNLKVVPSLAHHRREHRVTGKRRRDPGEPNSKVNCACGCGNTLMLFDGSGRPRQYISGHNVKIQRPDIQVECACGCGARFPLYSDHGYTRKYLAGHSSRKNPIEPNKIVSCACGCGTEILEQDKFGRKRRFVTGHNRQKKY